ncbi:hypothetical protein GE09DRAFT_1096541 [Coniochaeta sp. 2T2.1]|nr:hypothetical protein GE09DRAFT_1096541 [Coniochaeta sp. 2T2.1]
MKPTGIITTFWGLAALATAAPQGEIEDRQIWIVECGTCALGGQYCDVGGAYRLCLGGGGSCGTFGPCQGKGGCGWTPGVTVGGGAICRD